MEYLTLQLFNGLVNGSFYALLSLGLAVIFGVLRVVNFAHGAFYMLGAFAAYVLLQQTQIGFWPALLLAPLAVGAGAMVLERLLIRRLYHLDPLYNFLLTFGLTLVIQDGMRLRFGLQGQPYPAPAELAGSLALGTAAYPTYRLFVIAFSLAACFLVWYAIERTRLG
ncbi:MAG: branched-chain amino acid ABC transporter permease, partial [Thermoleophilaceae bacterium]